MASTGSEKKLGLLHLAICSLSFWGLGVSIGRFFPAHTPDSLAKRLTHACSTYEHIQTSALCHATIAAKVKVEEWTEATSGGVRQERLDAELVDFLSAVVSTEHDHFPERRKTTCTLEITSPLRLATCPTLPTLPPATEQTIQYQEQAGQFTINRLAQSWHYRTISLMGTFGTLFWKYVLFGTAGVILGGALGARYFFWPWVVFPWYWFFRDASAAYIVCWWGFATFAVHDLDFMKYKVSRGMIVAGLLVLTLMNTAWYLVRGSKEVSFSLFCLLAVAVPLDPCFEIVLTWLGGVGAQMQALGEKG